MRKVADEPENRMTAENVAMVMAPNLFLASSVANYSLPDAMDRELMLAESTSQITRLLLTHCNSLWMVRKTCKNAMMSDSNV
jgi:hypothetical protein